MLDRPDYSTCRQGCWNNCWLLSALVGLAAKRPDELRDLFTVHGDGTFTVAFPSYPPVVARNDQGTGTDSGPWPWAQLIEAAARQHFDIGNPRVLSFGLGIELLTGRGRTGYLNATGAGFAPGWRVWSRLRWFEDLLIHATQANRLMVLGGCDGTILRPRHDWIRVQHCYALLDYDAASNRVRIRDPRGVDDGIPAERKLPAPGEFWLTPEEVQADYCALSVENE
jgi:hypothetical protein